MTTPDPAPASPTTAEVREAARRAAVDTFATLGLNAALTVFERHIRTLHMAQAAAVAQDLAKEQMNGLARDMAAAAEQAARAAVEEAITQASGEERTRIAHRVSNLPRARAVNTSTHDLVSVEDVLAAVWNK